LQMFSIQIQGTTQASSRRKSLPATCCMEKRVYIDIRYFMLSKSYFVS